MICFERCDPWPPVVSHSYKHWQHTTVLDLLSVAEMEITEGMVEASTMENSRTINHAQTLKYAKFFVLLSDGKLIILPPTLVLQKLLEILCLRSERYSTCVSQGVFFGVSMRHEIIDSAPSIDQKG